MRHAIPRAPIGIVFLLGGAWRVWYQYGDKREQVLLRWRMPGRAGWSEASSPRLSTSAAVRLRRVPLPSGDDHGVGGLIPALRALLPPLARGEP
jgi:hypothetical protein